MGLLSDTTGRKKVSEAIQKHGTKVSFISFLCGLVWMALLANQEFNAKNYFSENQLLPGMAETYFSNTHLFYKHLRELQKNCADDVENMKTRKQVMEELKRLNLDVYEQHFHIKSKAINGTNIFGIYRAPRASGVESIVLNVPNHGGRNSSTGIAMMLSLAKFFRMQTYWAKDIIFLLTEHQLYGVKAWLSGYFEDETPDIIYDHLGGHGGSIQAALTLDLDSESISYLDLSIHGMNGMLPNLDLVHLLIRIANFESIPVKLDFQNAMYISPHDFKRSLETLLRSMTFQWSGIPTGNHGLFYKYRIEAYSLHGITSNPKIRSGHPIDFESLGRFIEGVFRSLNNLLEHVHQSFFMYLLPNTNRYISIGLYMPPLACLVAPLFISLLQTWTILFPLPSNEESAVSNSKSLSILADAGAIVHIAVAFGISHCIRYVYENKGWSLAALRYIDIHDNKNLFQLLILCCVVAIVIIRVCLLVEQASTSVVLKFYTALHLATTIAVTSIFNFSLAFAIAVFYVPACVLSSRNPRNLFTWLCLVLSVPFVFTFVTSSLMNIIESNETPFDEKWWHSNLQLWRNEMDLIGEYRNIGLWTSDILFTALLPLWILIASTAM